MAASDRWSQVPLLARHDWAPGLATFTVGDLRPEMHPGQFMNLALEGPKGLIKRAYSVASAPGEPLEFFIVEVEGGALTPRLFQLQRGDRVWADRRPMGAFTLRFVPNAPVLWLIATATGLAPFISMLRAGATDRFGQIVVVQGVRLGEQLAYADELRAHPKVTWIPMVSREHHPGALAGRVTAALLDGRLERAAGVDLSPRNSQVLMCGNPDMLSEMFDLLADRGMTRNRRSSPGHITLERYW
jgi:ferredoxin--NADP+ reductase